MIYDPNDAEQYSGLLRFTTREAASLGIRDPQDILHSTLIAAIHNNGHTVTIIEMKSRIEARVRRKRESTERDIVTFIAPVELEQHSKRRW